MVRRPIERATRLSDAQWQRLIELVRLPDGFRRRIEELIDWRRAAPPRHVWRQKFAKMSDAARGLSEKVDELGGEEIADLIDVVGPVNADRTARDQFRNDLRRWAGYFDKISANIKQKAVPDRDRQFIRAVAWAIEGHTGIETARRTKKPHALKPFLAMLCDMAQLNIGPGTIDETLKGLRRERKQRRGESPS